MSTAFYPTNMRHQSTNGYSNHNSQQNIPYITWKGSGIYSNPIGVTSTHIRPLTNNDIGNIFPTRFGLPRPLKHYRKGTITPILFNSIPKQYITNSDYTQQRSIAYNINRNVKSSKSSSLGGGSGGTGLISQLIEMPGSFSIKNNTNEPTIDKECSDCNGFGIVSNWMPISNLTEKPQPNVTNSLLCCSQERKAKQRVLPTNTNLQKNYYQTSNMYLYNRCQTFKQRQFNFINGTIDEKIQELFLSYPYVTSKMIEYSKPGDPLSINNLYVAQCIIDNSIEIEFIKHLSNILFEFDFITQNEYEIMMNESNLNIKLFFTSLENILTNEQYKSIVAYFQKLSRNYDFTNKKGCSNVYYKPNNPQYAKQGGVSSSTKILKLTVDTINTNAYNNKKSLSNSILATNIQYGVESTIPFIYKDKVSNCNPQTYSRKIYH